MAKYGGNNRYLYDYNETEALYYSEKVHEYSSNINYPINASYYTEYTKRTRVELHRDLMKLIEQDDTNRIAVVIYTSHLYAFMKNVADIPHYVRDMENDIRQNVETHILNIVKMMESVYRHVITRGELGRVTTYFCDAQDRYHIVFEHELHDMFFKSIELIANSKLPSGSDSTEYTSHINENVKHTFITVLQYAVNYYKLKNTRRHNITSNMLVMCLHFLNDITLFSFERLSYITSKMTPLRYPIITFRGGVLLSESHKDLQENDEENYMVLNKLISTSFNYAISVSFLKNTSTTLYKFFIPAGTRVLYITKDYIFSGDDYDISCNTYSATEDEILVPTNAILKVNDVYNVPVIDTLPRAIIIENMFHASNVRNGDKLYIDYDEEKQAVCNAQDNIRLDNPVVNRVMDYIKIYSKNAYRALNDKFIEAYNLDLMHNFDYPKLLDIQRKKVRSGDISKIDMNKYVNITKVNVHHNAMVLFMTYMLNINFDLYDYKQDVQYKTNTTIVHSQTKNTLHNNELVHVDRFTNAVMHILEEIIKHKSVKRGLQSAQHIWYRLAHTDSLDRMTQIINSKKYVNSHVRFSDYIRIGAVSSGKNFPIKHIFANLYNPDFTLPPNVAQMIATPRNQTIRRVSPDKYGTKTLSLRILRGDNIVDNIHTLFIRPNDLINCRGSLQLNTIKTQLMKYIEDLPIINYLQNSARPRSKEDIINAIKSCYKTKMPDLGEARVANIFIFLTGFMKKIKHITRNNNVSDITPKEKMCMHILCMINALTAFKESIFSNFRCSLNPNYIKLLFNSLLEADPEILTVLNTHDIMYLNIFRCSLTIALLLEVYADDRFVVMCGLGVLIGSDYDALSQEFKDIRVLRASHMLYKISVLPLMVPVVNNGLANTLPTGNFINSANLEHALKKFKFVRVDESNYNDIYTELKEQFNELLI